MEADVSEETNEREIRVGYIKNIFMYLTWKSP